MEALLTTAFLTALISGAVTAGMPLLLAGLGEQMSEKAGVLNVGIEGMMLAGAFGGFFVAYSTESIALGFLAGALAGCGVAILMALLCVRLGLNQIVIGIGLTLGFEGITSLLHYYLFGRTYPRLPAVETLPLPGIVDIPIIGPALFDRPVIVYVAVLFVLVASFAYRRTNLGLYLQAAGDKPAALDVTGIDVARVRTAAVLTAGTMAGLGGAFLAEVGAGLFVPFMTNGAGFISIVLAMLARGRPFWVLLGAAIFGACLSLTTALQVAGVNVPTDVIQMIPFAAVMAVLVIFGRNAHLPAALGIPYVRGAR
jgi:ABC-type uncharacterized transport system permease subunit